MENKLDKLINEVEGLKEDIKKLNKEIIMDSEELEDKEVLAIETITTFADGKPITMTTKYKYRDEEGL